MELALDYTRYAAKERDKTILDAQSRRVFSTALLTLKQNQQQLVERFPQALHRVLVTNEVQKTESPKRTLNSLSIHELELLDDSKVQNDIELVDARHQLNAAVADSLYDLTTRLGNLQGQRRPQISDNPLRPENFLRALQDVFNQLNISVEIQEIWLHFIAESLGKELNHFYGELSRALLSVHPSELPASLHDTSAPLSVQAGLYAISSSAPLMHESILDAHTVADFSVTDPSPREHSTAPSLETESSFGTTVTNTTTAHQTPGAQVQAKLEAQIQLRIINLPEAAHAPTEILEFLCGPWTQWLAKSQIDAIDKRQRLDDWALVTWLLWSVQPHLIEHRVDHLKRIIPKILSRLRKGLTMIHYPPMQCGAFFSQLANLHQVSFETATQALLKRTAAHVKPTHASTMATHATNSEHPDSSADAGIAPETGSNSTSVTITSEIPIASVPSNPSGTLGTASAPEKLPAILPELLSDHSDLPTVSDTHNTETSELANSQESGGVPLDIRVGEWVNLQIDNKILRMRLQWVNPKATLFVFESEDGSSHSMTRRTRDKLHTEGRLKKKLA